jgi:hypothetical protein
MPLPKRLPQRVKDVPWVEFRRRASAVFLMLQTGWSALSDGEREEVRRLITKSKGRPRNLSKPEARKLGRLAAKAARAAAAAQRRSG